MEKLSEKDEQYTMSQEGHLFINPETEGIWEAQKIDGLTSFEPRKRTKWPQPCQSIKKMKKKKVTMNRSRFPECVNQWGNGFIKHTILHRGKKVTSTDAFTQPFIHLFIYPPHRSHQKTKKISKSKLPLPFTTHEHLNLILILIRNPKKKTAQLSHKLYTFSLT